MFRLVKVSTVNIQSVVRDFHEPSSLHLVHSRKTLKMEKPSRLSQGLVPVLIALAFTTMPVPVRGLRFVHTGLDLPTEWCSPVRVSVVYKPGPLIYVFCKTAVLKYDLSIRTLVHLLDLPVSFESQISVGVNGEGIYFFTGDANRTGNLSIWTVSPMEAVWVRVVDLPDQELADGAVAVWSWEPRNHVYLFGTSQKDATIWKFSEIGRAHV